MTLARRTFLAAPLLAFVKVPPPVVDEGAAVIAAVDAVMRKYAENLAAAFWGPGIVEFLPSTMPRKFVTTRRAPRPDTMT